MTDLVEPSFNVKPLGPVRVQYSRKKLSFQAEGPAGVVGPWVIWFPITDRRLARRVARREGLRFTKADGCFVFRKKPS